MGGSIKNETPRPPLWTVCLDLLIVAYFDKKGKGSERLGLTKPQILQEQE
jgi:hypothetical protein